MDERPQVEVDRRQFLLGMAAVAAGSTLTGCSRALLSYSDHADGIGVGPRRVFIPIPTTVVPRSCLVSFASGRSSFEPNAVPPSAWLRVVRPADQLVLEFAFNNVEFRLTRRKSFRIHKRSSTAAAQLRVMFPPQHIAEQEVAFEFDKEIDPVILPRKGVFSGPSRLVFCLDELIQTCPPELLLSRLLEWRDLPMTVVPRALPPLGAPRPQCDEDIACGEVPTQVGLPGGQAPNPRPPGDWDTALELPYRLVLSPHLWSHWSRPSENDGLCEEARVPLGKIVELWHSRLAVGEPKRGRCAKLLVNRPDLKTVRAVDSMKDGDPPPGMTTLPSEDARQSIVANSGTYTDTDDKPYTPIPISFQELSLSSFGGYTRLHGRWLNPNNRGPKLCRAPEDPKDPANPSVPCLCPPVVDEWIQETTWGRDQFVLVSYKMYNVPFGQEMSFITVRQRRFNRIKDRKDEVAILNEYSFCKFRDEELSYQQINDLENLIGREMPFQWMRPRMLRTPVIATKILPPAEFRWEDEATKKCPLAFWITRLDDLQTPLPFEYDCLDRQGRALTLTMPLMCVSASVAKDTLKLKDVLQEMYLSRIERRTCNMRRQKLAFVPGSPRPSDQAGQPDDGIETVSMVWGVDGEPDTGDLELPPAWLERGKLFPPRFYPRLDSAQVRLDAVAAMSIDDSKSGSKVRFNDEFYKSGFDRARLDIYLDVAENGAELPFSPERGGGLATPSMGIANISRIRGPWGGAGQPIPNQTLFPPARTPSVIPEAQVVNRVSASGGLKATTVVGFNPNTFFQHGAKLLGGVALREVIGPVANAVDDLAKVPALIAEKAQSATVGLTELKDKVRAIQAWMEEFRNLDSFAEIRTLLLKDIEKEITKQLVCNWNETLRDYVEREQVLVDEFADKLAQTVIDTAQIVDNEVKKAVHAALRSADFTATLQAASLAMDVYAIVNATKPTQLADRAVKALERVVNVNNAEAKVRQAVSAWAKAELKPYLERLHASAGRLRERAIAELMRVNGWNEAQIKTLRDEFTKAVSEAITVISVRYTRCRAAVRELERFPAPEIMRLRDDINDLIDVVKNPDGRILNLPAKLDRFADDINALLGQATQETRLKAFIDRQTHAARTIAEQTSTAMNEKVAIARAFTDQWQEVYVKLKAKHTELGALTLPDVVKEFVTFEEAWNGVRNQIAGQVDKHAKEALSKLSVLWDEQQRKLATTVETLLTRVADEVFRLLEQALVLVDRIRNEIRALLESIPQELALDYAWTPALQDAPKDKPFFEARSSAGPASFTLSANIRKSLRDAAKPPTVRIAGELKNFTIHLLPSTRFISVEFDSLKFLSVDGRAPEFRPKIANVTLGESLAFVQKLAEVLSPETGPYLELAGTIIKAGFRFDLPSITSGIFNLTQLGIVSEIQLPLTGDPTRVRFSISRRDKPFLLTVGILGGGGFFALQLNPTGVDLIEGSMEFGAAIFLDVSVAKGHASITAGVYFSTQGDNSCLKGFVRACGSLRVIGIISVSLVLELSLGYERREGRSVAAGECVMTLSIEIGFFSVDVTLRYRKEMEGSKDSARIARESSRSDPAAAPPVAPLTAEQERVEQYLQVREGWKQRRKRYYAWSS
jgi:hypothetical protein